MRSLKFQSLWHLTLGLLLANSILFSPIVFGQELTETLSLRLGPGIGFPVGVEVPSGAEITITQQRHTWLLVVNERDERGWAEISTVMAAGGLTDRQAWRLSELKKRELGSLQGRWFRNEQDYGLSLGWRSRTSDGYWLMEVEKSTNTQTEWQAVSAWYMFKKPINPQYYYSLGLGLGISHENDESHVFSEAGESLQTGFGGFELALGFQPVKQIETGLSLRYLLADHLNDGDSTVVSWYWLFGI
jgi:hypothetical protein